jgi:hypothetical protein
VERLPKNTQYNVLLNQGEKTVTFYSWRRLEPSRAILKSQHPQGVAGSREGVSLEYSELPEVYVIPRKLKIIKFLFFWMITHKEGVKNHIIYTHKQKIHFFGLAKATFGIFTNYSEMIDHLLYVSEIHSELRNERAKKNKYPRVSRKGNVIASEADEPWNKVARTIWH